MPAAFAHPAIRTLLVGLPGILVMPFVLLLPPDVPAGIAMLNPLILLIAAAMLGQWAAPKIGLPSALILGSRIRLRNLALWSALGLCAGLAIAVLDHATASLWSSGNVPTLRENRDAATLALGLLYGGLTEEVIFRWGLLSLLAIGLSRLLPLSAALAIAALLAAILFALAHLPATLLDAGFATPALITRTLLWNALLGLGYGIALIRHGMEAAILAHMATHLGFALAAF